MPTEQPPRMAAWKALECIGMFGGPADILDMKYQTCLGCHDIDGMLRSFTVLGIDI